jgi:hypothetical protein
MRNTALVFGAPYYEINRPIRLIQIKILRLVKIIALPSFSLTNRNTFIEPAGGRLVAVLTCGESAQ